VLYRAMDYLLERQEELEKELFWSVSTLINLEVDLLFFDTTSTYFETENQTDLKKRGYSKDNLRYLQRAGGHYIVGRKLKSGEPAAELALARKGHYTQIKENLRAREVSLGGDGEKRKRLVLVRNSDEEKKQLLVRQQIVETIEEMLEKINNRKGHAHTKATCALKSHAVYGKYVKELQDGRLKLDKSKAADESRYDGKFLIKTSDDTLCLREVVLSYKPRNAVEQAFRTLKTTLDLRPNYHSKDERIRCHIFLCFLALVLVRIVENKTKRSWPSVRQEMARLFLGELIIEKQHIQQLTELTKNQKEILAKLGIAEPQSIVDIR